MTQEDIRFKKELNKLSKQQLIKVCVKYRNGYLNVIKRLETAEKAIEAFEEANNTLDELIASLPDD